MQWTDKQSIKLSTWCIYVLAMLIFMVMIFISSFIDAIVPSQMVSSANRFFFILTLELCLGIGLVILYFLYQLIRNIEKEKIFTEQNIKLLRITSWLCFLEAIILLISSSYYFPWFFVAGVAAFVGVIVRIIKNVFCQARLIKEENDFTI
ncbi:DUF2975 domain-containing protein [Enterococcus sp. BWB1-3]|uniref:DUF2975 domain-containing protein n=1 Tax=unclassified Enterococcus TaxID=2608891 RepID=UPI001921C7B7|nr:MULTISPECIES: DUF2975 domain-containing protein [unclassified Enterococcus]MBL1229107.1 DUF2975 domain-containing protein [Enterococcus sp. BWB1-3]MCB5952481.1 DUF2975 domain-containing protein [Enterococcus sp. BWT-B8]MCB5953478.1 DUF2975 domain-containing protein [Enterococcus sp. CWB-B31]